MSGTITTASGATPQSVSLLPGRQQTDNPRFSDTGTDGTNNVGQFTNVYWLNDSQGNGGYSHYGIDNRGIALRANGVD
ncbi:MAG: hypothetical protein WAP03_30585 [Methylorubrum rhodinum]|uniref:hypothetical protein n=1 Tax=Methylorubrum rhodinum TaxID=29428 RepID=UPI003BAE4987